LLIKEPEEWKAITYVWNDEQTEAFLEIAGDDKQVKFIDKSGTTQQLRYVIPNQNQCKGCHNVNDRILPIGPSVDQLNGNYLYASGTKNQIAYWKKLGMLKHVPASSSIPKTVVWNDPKSGSLDARARAYLAVNCAHCHRREGLHKPRVCF
jgi:cytochrome c553